MPSPTPAPAASMTAEHGQPATDTPAEAQGRRTLSTAFVRTGPDRLLTVELRDGHVLLLHDVTMGQSKYCGASGGASGPRFCAGYGDVAAARPGGGPAATVPVAADAAPAAPARRP